MIHNFRQLLRYRALVQSLVARELKARYRGSFLGFFWSFLNPLLLLLIYTFVFTRVMPLARGTEAPQMFALFLFAGILPWTWFSSSLLESANVLIAGGNLIRKVMFPAEVLPIVTVLAGLAHFTFGLPILVASLVYFGIPIEITDLFWVPIVMLVQLTLTVGLALLISALTVHFRDLRDLLTSLVTLWFWATPIVYRLSDVPASFRPVVELNPFTYLAVAYQETLVVPGRFVQWPRLVWLGAASVLIFTLGYAVFDRLRETFAEEV